MTTRDEQLAAAERISALDPDWHRFPMNPLALMHPHGAWIMCEGTGARPWRAYMCAGLTHPLRTKALSIRAFSSPAAAIRALGYTVSDE